MCLVGQWTEPAAQLSHTNGRSCVCVHIKSNEIETDHNPFRRPLIKCLGGAIHGTHAVGPGAVSVFWLE